MKLSALIVPVLGLASLSAQSSTDVNFCTLTADAALHSCQLGAQSDLFLARGKCDNVAAAAGRTKCRNQASTDYTDALNTCDAEHSVRQNACKFLGPKPYAPVIDPADFTAKIDNPYFPLQPGTVFIYEGRISNGLEHTEFFVTHRTRKILGVTTVVVHDSVFTNGKLTENTFDYFAQDKDGNVWYFGEDTEELVNGLPSTLEGSFISGVNRAKPGIIMEAHPHIGDFYRQEFDLGNAEDFALVKALNDTVTVPFGSFTHCLRTRETTPLEPDLKEAKWYALGVGNILTKDLTTGETNKLIRIESR